jgi:hypothetical protein
MNNYFRRIDSNLFVGLDEGNLKNSTHMVHDKWQKYGLALKKTVEYEAAITTTYNISPDLESAILSTIPVDLLELEIPKAWYLEVSGSTNSNLMIPPHVDKFRICTINYYMEASGEVTHYYDYQSKGNICEIDSFCAKQDECWILNTDIPHAVSLLPEKTRRILGVSFVHTSFEKVSSFFS